MARHTITIPINKSSNGTMKYELPNTDLVTPAPISDILLMHRHRSAYPNLIGLAWDSNLMPINKEIISIKLHLYSKYTWQKTIVYGSYEFTEGVNIPPIPVADGGLPGAFVAGWNILDISDLKGTSVTIGSDTVDYNTWGEFHSHRNPTNKPYVVVTYDDIPPGEPKSLYPANITLNPREIIKFSWLHDSKEGQVQKAFSLQYSTNDGGTWTTIAQTTTNEYYDMPASTLPTSGTILWRVKTTDTNGEESTYSTTSFTLGVVPQKAPVLISPISQYIDENNPIRFEWIFSGGAEGETQSKYDLQYSINGGTTWTTVTVTSMNKYYDLAAKTLTSGNITWRVRTYNNWNEVSPYSENRSFTIIGSPPIPQILTITNSARPLITWQATGQHIYEIEIVKNSKVIFETGAIPSFADRDFKLEDYLEDGSYIVRLRILNEYNLYSPWAEKSFILSTTKPPIPIVDVYSHEYSVAIKTSNTSLKTLVYRDSMLLGEVIEDSFIDYTGENNKEYKYLVRTIDSNDNFSDSIMKLAKCHFNDNTLALISEPDQFVKLKYGFGNIPKKSSKTGVVGYLSYYDGRVHPIAEFTEFESKEKTVSFFIKTKEELDRLNELVDRRKALLYRDYNGENILGVVFSIDDEKTIFGYEINFTIIKTEV